MKKKFSERIGLSPPPKIQIDEMNEVLRNSIWNFLYENFNDSSSSIKTNWIKLAKHIAVLFRKTPVDNISINNFDCLNWVKRYFFSLNWYQVYDLLEFLYGEYNNIRGYSSCNKERFVEITNKILKEELSGYRFIDGQLAPISNETEIQEIEDSLEATKKNDLHGAQEHIEKALSLFGKKPDPDYRNSIKEAISAVESVAKLLSKKSSAGVSDALKTLQTKMDLHPALKAAFEKMYGYTSDEDGIRHAILEESDVGFDEAKYMIVACSAFVNFLIAKADSAGLFPNE